MKIYKLEIKNGKVIRFGKNKRKQILKEINNKEKIVFEIRGHYYVIKENNQFDTCKNCDLLNKEACLCINGGIGCVASYLSNKYGIDILKEKELFEIKFAE